MEMNITYLELSAKDLPAQRDFYASILELPVNLDSSILEVKAGETNLLFTQAPSEFIGAYHFAFNIPENQYHAAKQWIASRIPLLRDKTGKEDFELNTWTSTSLYFLDAAGNVLEFIARHTLNNASKEEFDSRQILNISEIGLPSENVIELANDLCTRLGVSVYKQEPNENFTPVGDENGLLILPAKDRIWMPDSGVPAKLLPVKVRGAAKGREWEVRGVPYEIFS
jgi:catechol 2,3-dioxygenase-like lactoylglutathione lyase family enzyme